MRNRYKYNSTQIKNWLDTKIDDILLIKEAYGRLNKPLGNDLGNDFDTCGYDAHNAEDIGLFIHKGIDKLAKVAGCELVEDVNGNYRSAPCPFACMMFMYRGVKVFQLCNIDEEGNVLWTK